MRKLIIVAILGCISLQATAQDVWKEIDQDPRRSASNYMAYPEPTKPLTPAPKGVTARALSSTSATTTIPTSPS